MNLSFLISITFYLNNFLIKKKNRNREKKDFVDFTFHPHLFFIYCFIISDVSENKWICLL